MKKAKWTGIRRIPFNVSRLTQMALNEVFDSLEISEFIYQKHMSFFAGEMGGKYYDGIIKLNVAPYEIHVHYLKYNENLGTEEDPDWEPYVAWVVYPKDQKNRSKMFKIFESPMEGSKQVWPKFLKWMEIIVEAVNTIRVTKGEKIEDWIDKYSHQKSKRAKEKLHERNRKNRI